MAVHQPTKAQTLHAPAPKAPTQLPAIGHHQWAHPERCPCDHSVPSFCFCKATALLTNTHLSPPEPNRRVCRVYRASASNGCEAAESKPSQGSKASRTCNGSLHIHEEAFQQRPQKVLQDPDKSIQLAFTPNPKTPSIQDPHPTSLGFLQAESPDDASRLQVSWGLLEWAWKVSGPTDPPPRDLGSIGGLGFGVQSSKVGCRFGLSSC